MTAASDNKQFIGKMETKLFETDDAIKTVYQLYGRNEESLAEDVTTLKKWMKTQPHLPELLDDKSIENFFILNKCSVERAKRSIDMYYTIRTLTPDLYEHGNPKNSSMKLVMEIADWVVLPKLTKDKYRVILFKMRNKELINTMDVQSILSLFLNIQEVRLKEDVMIGDVHIVDMEGINLGYVRKITPTFIMKTVFMYQKVFSIRVKGTYFVNSLPFLVPLLLIIKRFVKPKIFARVHLCEDTSILLENFPKEILPRDYGGEEKSVRELQDELLNSKLSQYQDRFDELDKLRVDESLRPEKLDNDEILGFHGNFKKLSVD